MLRFTCKIGWLGSLLFVAACQAQLPPDYSPDYVRVPVASEEYPNKVKRVLIPKACLNPDPTADDIFGEKIPPGCANAYNLQRMAERKGDLFHGRNLSPAPAAPSVRAAQKYLNGEKNAPKGNSSGGGVSEEGGASIVSEPAPAGPKQVSTQNR
jgi:hypothetical protein